MPSLRSDGGFEALDGFGADDLGAAFTCFRSTAEGIARDRASLRPAVEAMSGLKAVALAALQQPPSLSSADARRFFEDHFTPAIVTAESGEDAFFTGYYEPIVRGALAPSTIFTAPLLARPASLKTFSADEPRPEWAATLSAARRTHDDGLEPYPDRTTIERSIGSGSHRPLVWLRDWVEVFLIHVQGSARVVLEDGRALRLTYDGRNGHPYTSIGRLLVERGEVAPGTMSLDWLKAWIRERGQQPGEAGRALMAQNASYIFFAAKPLDDEVGPTGGAGVPLTALRSIAVDRSVWCYGLPFWVEADLPWQNTRPLAFRRLMVAQDTGSAILGPARADLFFGSGDEAGHRAGDIRHRGRFVVLLPRLRGNGA